MKEFMDFYLLATSLKHKIRQGSIYWNVKLEHRESVAEHVYDTCILAIGLNSQFDFNVDIQKVLEMLIVHELEEVIIGDITPFDGISEEEKLALGDKAVQEILSGLKLKDKYIALTDEFNAKSTKEAEFAFLCDKLDFVLQMMLYCDQGFITLGDGTDKRLLNSSKIQEIMAKEGTTARDIFYEFDLDKFKDNPIAMEVLNFAYSNNLSKILEDLLQSKN